MNSIWGTWDIETKKRCECQTPQCRHVPAIDQWSCQLSDGNFCQGNSKKELVNFFLSLTEKKSKRYLLYAHNGNAYDIFFLIDPFIKLMDKEERAKFKPKRNQRSCQEIRWRNIRFLDSYLLLKKKLGEIMNKKEQEKKNLLTFTTNGERIYNWEIAKKCNLENEDQLLSEYNKNDTQALYRILDQVWKKYPQAKGRSTIAGLSFYLWKKENPQQLKKLNNLAKPWADKIRNFCQRGYWAALEDNFNESIYEKTAYKYDVNSFYPYLMKTCTFPLGRPRFTEKVRQEFNPEKEIGFFEVQFEDLQIKKQEGWEPFLQIENNEGSKANFGASKTYQAVLPTPTLELALKAYSYSKFTILRKCLFLQKEQGYFKDFVEKYATIKENSKRDSLNYVMAKNILNNLYGKFGQRVFRQQWNLQPVEKKISFAPTYWDNNGNPWHFRLSKKPKRTNGFNYVPIAAFVTSYARIFMAKIIQEKGQENFLYCGKDSLISKIPFLPDEIHHKRTGAWKLEIKAKELISHSVKAYKLKESIFKSLSRKEAQQLDFRELQTKPLKVKSKISQKTNQGVAIFEKEKIFRPAIENQKKDLINGRWVAKKFYYGWDWWKQQERIRKKLEEQYEN